MNKQEQNTLDALTKSLYLILTDGEGVMVEIDGVLLGVCKNEQEGSVIVIPVSKLNFSEGADLHHGQRFTLRPMGVN